jgi:hypothetical protein
MRGTADAEDAAADVFNGFVGRTRGQQGVGLDDLLDRLLQRFQSIGGATICGYSKPISLLLLKNVRHLAQLVGDGAVGRRHHECDRQSIGSPPSTADENRHGARADDLRRLAAEEHL